MVTLTKEDEIYILDLGASDNVFNLHSMGQIEDALETVAASRGPAALLTTARGKIWTVGFDVDWMTSRPSDDKDVEEIIKALERIISQLLQLPVMTIAVIQGHCFAAGALFAMAHDVRMMRTEKGYFCLPEVELDVPFSTGLSTLLQRKLPSATAFEAMLTGRRYGAAEALRAGIVDDAFPLNQLRESALERAKTLAVLAGGSMQGIRVQLCQEILEALDSDK